MLTIKRMKWPSGDPILSLLRNPNDKVKIIPKSVDSFPEHLFYLNNRKYTPSSLVNTSIKLKPNKVKLAEEMAIGSSILAKSTLSPAWLF